MAGRAREWPAPTHLSPASGHWQQRLGRGRREHRQRRQRYEAPRSPPRCTARRGSVGHVAPRLHGARCCSQRALSPGDSWAVRLCGRHAATRGTGRGGAAVGGTGARGAAAAARVAAAASAEPFGAPAPSRGSVARTSARQWQAGAAPSNGAPPPPQEEEEEGGGRGRGHLGPPSARALRRGPGVWIGAGDSQRRARPRPRAPQRRRGGGSSSGSTRRVRRSPTRPPRSSTCTGRSPGAAAQRGAAVPRASRTLPAAASLAERGRRRAWSRRLRWGRCNQAPPLHR